MRKRIWILLPLLCILAACGRRIAEPVNTGTEYEDPAGTVSDLTDPSLGESANPEAGQSKTLNFRTLYRGFSPVSWDDREAMEAYSSFGVKVITNEDDWGTFMGTYCPGIPYEEPFDFEKEYLVVSIMQGSRPGYIGAEPLNSLGWQDGYFLPEYGSDPSRRVYALGGDSVTHFYVEVLIVSREDVPWVAEEQVYSPADALTEADLTGDTWEEAYCAVLGCDRKQLLADPDAIRYPEDSDIYLGIHDFDGDGIPELIYGDGVSLAVFTYSDGQVERLADLYFPGKVWCVNGVAFKGNGMSAICNGSGGSDFVNFGYVDGEYVLGRYSQQSPDIEPTINEIPATREEVDRIHTTEYSKIGQEEFREKIRLDSENGVLLLPSGERIPLDDSLDFDRFLWE